MTRRAIRAAFAAAVAAAGLSATALSAAAAPASQLEAAPASAIRAGMLVNFVKFTDWPPESGAGTQLTLCVVDDPAVAEALETMTRGRSIERRQLVLKRMKLDGPLAECQLLYVAGVNRDKTRQLLARVKDAPVFTVSDFEEFALLGGVVHFFVQGGRMRFAVNPAAAQRARLKLSSQLLGVATIVKDEHAH